MSTTSSPVKNVFVLMLENRAFDHMIGLDQFPGIDAVTLKKTTLNALNGNDLPSNTYGSGTYPVLPGAPNQMSVDPGHEFEDVTVQLGTATNPMSGFVQDFAVGNGWNDEGDAPANALYSVMASYLPNQVPVLNQLAKEFCICDNYFCSLPGPTWPNRFFVHAATSGGIFASPSSWWIMKRIALNGVNFENGNIFSALEDKIKGSPWKIFHGVGSTTTGDIPQACSLKGVSLTSSKVKKLRYTGDPSQKYNTPPYWKHVSDDNFYNELNDTKKPYDTAYTFIEPAYGEVSSTFEGGSSQHPMDAVTSGEGLVKYVYETIRNSPIWNQSLLIITYDEHGGFYDHITPPAAVPPGDEPINFNSDDTKDPNAEHMMYTFGQYGIRVPAIVVSPYVMKNSIDHTLYDHSSVLSTIESIFGLKNFTARDKAANNFMHLANMLSVPRTDCPFFLSDPAGASAFKNYPTPPPKPAATDDAAMYTSASFGSLMILRKTHLEMAPAEEHEAINKRVESIRTIRQFKAYHNEVTSKVNASKGEPRHLILPGERIEMGDYLVSRNNAYYIIMESGGNLCIYSGSGPGNQGALIWAAPYTSSGPGPTYFAMLEHNGALNIKMKGDASVQGTSDSVLWTSGITEHDENYFLSMEENGNVVIYHGLPGETGGILWAAPSVSLMSNYMDTNSYLPMNGYITSRSKNCFLLMNGDCYLYLYQGSGPDDTNKVKLWKSDNVSTISAPCYAILMPGGSLTIYEGAAPSEDGGEIAWNTVGSTDISAPFFAEVDDDMSLVIYKGIDPTNRRDVAWIANMAITDSDITSSGATIRFKRIANAVKHDCYIEVAGNSVPTLAGHGDATSGSIKLDGLSSATEYIAYVVTHYYTGSHAPGSQKSQKITFTTL